MGREAWTMVCGATCLCFSSARRKSLGRGELDPAVFCFVKPEDAEAFRDRSARNCPRRLIGTHGAKDNERCLLGSIDKGHGAFRTPCGRRPHGLVRALARTDTVHKLRAERQ